MVLSEEKSRIPGARGTVSLDKETRLSGFMFKTVGAAMVGAALPALVFYFLF